MATYVALLCSIVLGSGRRVVMADLNDFATGNLVFEAARTTPAKLEPKIEPAFARAFGRPIDIIG